MGAGIFFSELTQRVKSLGKAGSKSFLLKNVILTFLLKTTEEKVFFRCQKEVRTNESC